MTGPFLARGSDRAFWPRFAFMVSADRRRWGLVSGMRKVIDEPQVGVLESHDLASDPGERRNLADEGDMQTCRLLTRLVSWRRNLLQARRRAIETGRP